MSEPIAPLHVEWAAPNDTSDEAPSWHLLVGGPFAGTTMTLGQWLWGGGDSFVGRAVLREEIWPAVCAAVRDPGGPPAPILAENILARLYADLDDSPCDELDQALRQNWVDWIQLNRTSPDLPHEPAADLPAFLYDNRLHVDWRVNAADPAKGVWFITHEALGDHATLSLGHWAADASASDYIVDATIPMSEWPAYLLRLNDFNDDDPDGLADEIVGRLSVGIAVPDPAVIELRRGLLEGILSNRARAADSARRIEESTD